MGRHLHFISFNFSLILVFFGFNYLVLGEDEKNAFELGGLFYPSGPFTIL